MKSQRGEEAKDCGQQMRGGGEADCDGEQHDARTPPAARPLHGVGDSDGGVDEAVESPHGEEVVVRRDRHAYDGGTEAVEAEREEAALVAVETARDPPQATAQQQREEDKGQVENKERQARVVAVSQTQQGERKSDYAIGEDAVAVDSECFGGELLVADDPETLGEEGQQKERGKTLRPPDVDAREGHAAMAGGSIFTLVCALFRWMRWFVSRFECIARAGPGAEALPFMGHHSGA